MKEENNIIPDFKKAFAVKENFANSYGFDLSNPNLIGYTTGGLRFTVMGYKPNAQYDRMIATVKVTHALHVHEDYVYRQTLNLYHNDQVIGFCRNSETNLKLNNADVIKKGIYSLIERLEQYRDDELKNTVREEKETPVSRKEIDDAKEILKIDNLLDCIQGLLKQAGVETEQENGLRLFLILLSRHFDRPLHALLQGSPQLCRNLLETITSVIPSHQLHQQTSMSAGSLYYTKEKNYWKHKVLYLTSIERNFKGVSTIKEFIENTVLKRQTTEKDYLTRQLFASNKIVNGGITLVGYSENESLNTKFFQECFFIRIEENQTNRTETQEYLKRESSGLIDTEEQEQAKRMLKEIQRQIKRKKVVVPYAMDLQLPDSVFQPLRSLPQLLTFIKTVALLHQHQLKTKTDSNGVEYIEATPEHLEIAVELFKSILITQSDSLSLTQRSFLESLKTQVKSKDKSFKISELIPAMEISSSKFYREFATLTKLGYIKENGGDKKKGVEYNVIIWDDYQTIKNGMNILDEQVKKIKEASFLQVSHKIPTKQKAGKNYAKQVIQAKAS